MTFSSISPRELLWSATPDPLPWGVVIEPDADGMLFVRPRTWRETVDEAAREWIREELEESWFRRFWRTLWRT